MIINQPLNISDEDILTLKDLYYTWRGMIRRCHSLSDGNYHNYGGRGITVCDRWKKSYVNFIRDVWPRPKGMSLDRIDNNSGYRPDNVRWATQQQQCWNLRKNIRPVPESVSKIKTHIPDAKGEIPLTPPKTSIHNNIIPERDDKCIAELAKDNGLSYVCLHHRLARGMKIDEALEKPISNRGGQSSLERIQWQGKEYTLKDLAELHGQDYKACHARLNKLGWTMEQALGLAPKPPRKAHNKANLTPEQIKERQKQWSHTTYLKRKAKEAEFKHIQLDSTFRDPLEVEGEAWQRAEIEAGNCPGLGV